MTKKRRPVGSSGWFGDVFISSKISGPCTGNVPAKHAKYTKRNPWRGRYTSGLQAQQELTEQTEGRVSLRSLCCLLFKSPSAARSRRTVKVSLRTEVLLALFHCD